MTVHELLLKRFATKKFDPSKKIYEEDLKYILEAARLSASSANTQPWRILVVKNQEVKNKLLPISYNQSQVVDAPVVLVIAIVKDPMIRIQKTAAIIAASSGQTSADAYVQMVKGWIPSDERSKLEWLQRQVYLALQAMMLAAIEKGIDSCPMEGFNSTEYAHVLNLKDEVPTVVLPLGYSLTQGFLKVRVPIEDIVLEIN